MASTNNTVIYLRFNEASSPTEPTDDAAGLEDLKAFTGLGAPSVVEGVVGYAREWQDDNGFQASEKTVGQTRLLRDATVEAIVLISPSVDGTYRLIRRGSGDGSPSERVLYQMDILVAAGVVSMQMGWQRASGADATVPAVTFDPPDGWWYVAATRRWISTTEIEVCYFVNGELVGAVTSAHGDIQDGVGGTTYVGVIDPGLAYGAPGGLVIDELKVSRISRTAEEIRQTYRRMFYWPEVAYAFVRALLPPGQAYSTDPSSAIQRELRVEADGLALTLSLLAELEDDFLPDRATRTLERWEKLTGLAPRNSDSIAKRRLRVVTFLRKVHGFNRDQVREALAEILDYEDPEDIEIIERSNRFVDEFPGATIGLWWTDEANGGSVAVSGGNINLTSDAGDDNSWSPTQRQPVCVYTTIADPREVEIVAKVRSMTADPTVEGGIFVWNAVSEEAHLAMVQNDAGAISIAVTLLKGGAETTTTHAIGAIADPFWVRYKRNADETADVAYSLDSEYGPWTTIRDGVETIDQPDWAGLAVRATTDPSDGGILLVDRFMIWCPEFTGVYDFYLFRDPLDPGEPDIQGAQMALAKTKPAHTNGTVIQSKVALCDDPYTLCDRDILGG